MNNWDPNIEAFPLPAFLSQYAPLADQATQGDGAISAITISSAANDGGDSESTTADGADDTTASLPRRAALRRVDNRQREMP
ncbi:MAG: hypothetical protein OXU81_10010 [Gammaproteobacteria bacterium]|nr:hypothetical protein [Gammaproteobacteria bacterium]